MLQVGNDSPQRVHFETTRPRSLPPRARHTTLIVRVDGVCTLRLLRGRKLVVGSQPGADIHLRDPYVSGRHCELCLVEDGVRVVDLGSKNGTFVEGMRIERARVHASTVIVVGEQRIHIEARTGQRSASRAAEARSLAPRGAGGMPGMLGMIGMSRTFRKLQGQLERLAPVRQPVLLRGETGTGKELAARALHDASPRAAGPFVAINCATIVDGLAESMLFGHVRGAFTGAHRDHQGAFARAHGGTLFLDEVAELPLELQAKLLRTLETKSVLPVGARKPVAVDVRIVSATHRSLRAEVEAGRFRADLMYRLRVIPVFIPPLRERPGDVRLLTERFVEELSARGRRQVDQIAPATFERLEAHAWPGNVRELRNVLAYAFAIGDGPVLMPGDLPPEIGADTDDGARRPLVEVPGEDEPSPSPEADSPEARRILRALERAGGNRERAARILGVSRVTLWRRMKALSLHD